jgi:hypothetical protein
MTMKTRKHPNKRFSTMKMKKKKIRKIDGEPPHKRSYIRCQEIEQRLPDESELSAPEQVFAASFRGVVSVE